MQAETEPTLLGQLNVIDQDLYIAPEVLAELPRGIDGQPAASGVTSIELRSIGRRLVSSGDDLAGLGMAADQRDEPAMTMWVGPKERD